jgi:hypothetical protein
MLLANPKAFSAHDDLNILSALMPMPPRPDPRESHKNSVESARMMSSIGVVSIAEIAGQSLKARTEILHMWFAAPGTKLGNLEISLKKLYAGGDPQ